MKIDVSDDVLKTVLKEIINSQNFGKKLSERVDELAEEKIKLLLDQYYDRGFEDGMKSRKE